MKPDIKEMCIHRVLYECKLFLLLLLLLSFLVGFLPGAHTNLDLNLQGDSNCCPSEGQEQFK